MEVYARIYFPWIDGEFHCLEEDLWRNFYNGSRLHELVGLAGTSQASPQTTTILEETIAEGNNTMQDK